MAKSKLALYQQKRDFTKTAEPSGRAKIAPAEYPRFVIQKHAATRLHYDLRLEVDGVFKSWAVTKGPSLDPATSGLPSKPRTIRSITATSKARFPKASMAAGRSCCGTAASGRRTAMPHKGPAQGRARFTLVGEKLQGSWVLVRLRHDRERGKRTNWLLIKRHDGYEREGDGDAILSKDRSVASGRTMDEIAAGKGRSPKPFMLGRQTASRRMRSGIRTARTDPPKPATLARGAEGKADVARARARHRCQPSSRRSFAKA